MKHSPANPLRVTSERSSPVLDGVRSTAGRKSPNFVFVAVACLPLLFCGASHRTTNFIVTAPTAQQAQAIAERAEEVRTQLALDWLDRELDRWDEPCPVLVVVGEHLTPRGETSYLYREGRATAWDMHVEGPWSTIYRSVLPHEIAHAVFATHFGRGLPRWAEEGVCVLVEHHSDQQKLERVLVHHMGQGRMLPLPNLFALEVYPADVMAMYTQGYSLVRFFVERGGKQKFIQYLDEGLLSRDWHAATLNHYGYRDLHQLENAWLGWAVVQTGAPSTSRRPGALLTSTAP